MDLAALTRLPEFDHPPERVVSLIPSTTENLFVLGFGESVVGVTDYCTSPAEKLVAMTRVGGPKKPNIEQIIALQPELVFANQEENSAATVEALTAAGIRVWLSFPQTIDDAIVELNNLSAIYHTDRTAMQIRTLQVAADTARSAVEYQQKVRYFCPIWQGEDNHETWWMTFNQQTYAHDVLAMFGGQNIFAERQRRYPLAADLGKAEPEDAGERDVRYPRVTVEEVLAAEPELILLPDDPFDFSEQDKDRFLDLLSATPAVKTGRIVFIDGRLIAWYGVRLGRAFQELPLIFG